MSFVQDKDSDNYITNKYEWERIKDYIPTDKNIKSTKSNGAKAGKSQSRRFYFRFSWRGV